MKKPILFFIYLMTSQQIMQGQHATIVSAGTSSGLGGSISYSIGEPIISYESNASIALNHGVQQPEINVRISVKAILSGCYDQGLGLMHDSLRKKKLIPLDEPYSFLPYQKPTILENAYETLDSNLLNITGDNALVDWIFLELRSALTPSLILATKRALIQRDGDIVSNLDGVSPVLFSYVPNGSYYITVKHRNHLGVMTANPIYLSQQTQIINFTNLSTVYSISNLINAPRRIEGGLYTLWPGDANNNKNTKYNGYNNDKDYILYSALGGAGSVNTSLSDVYRVHDLNLDGIVRYNNTDNDRVVILNAVGVNTPNNIFYQHTPN